MNKFKEIDGDIIELSKAGMFDVIIHGCNCFCKMESGLAPQMVTAYNVDEYDLEHVKHKGNINKLGNIDYGYKRDSKPNYVVNAYTQYSYGYNTIDRNNIPLMYCALELALIKIDNIFSGKVIGIPLIGGVRGGGDYETIKTIIKKNLKNCDVTLVMYKK